MRVVHTAGENSVEGDCENPSFMMTNKNGGFCWFDSMTSKSRYQGVYFSQSKKLFRVIEDIQQGEEVVGFRNKFWCVERVGKTEQERFFMPDGKNLFHYESGKRNYVFLDFKEAYADKYAKYSVEELKDMLIVRMEVEQAKYYLVIRYSGQFSPEKRWVEREYTYDLERKSHPSKRSVYFLGEFSRGQIMFSFSNDLDQAVKEVNQLDTIKNLEHDKKTRTRITIGTEESKEKVEMAYNACKVQLDNLLDEHGLFAGLPWFFQYWSRDELISLKALKRVDPVVAKKIIRNWFEKLDRGLVIPSKRNIDESFVGNSLDAFGWLLKRIENYPEILISEHKKLEEFFEKIDSEIIDNGEPSWMDSIERQAPVEVQSMKLYALKLAHKLTGKKKYRDLEKALKQKVKTKYFDKGWLFDFDRGWSDHNDEKRIRPNIFIVYYFYPELLDKKEWEEVMDNELPELFNEWGGLATISKKDHQFHEQYTGEEPGSYHNGDSWFWINNLAGICLTDLNKKKYYEYIKKILTASTTEILFSGAIGNHAELSSSNSLKSEGAPCQAFSAAMFIEFVDALRECH